MEAGSQAECVRLAMFMYFSQLIWVYINVSLSRSNLGNPLAALMYCELWFPDQLPTQLST